MKENATAILQPRASARVPQSLVPTTRVRAFAVSGVPLEVVRTSKGSRRFTVKDPVTGLKVIFPARICYGADAAIREAENLAHGAPDKFAALVAAARAAWSPKLRVTYPAA